MVENRLGMWDTISKDAYSSLVIQSVEEMYANYSDYDSKWNSALIEVAKLYFLDVNNPTEIPYSLEDKTIESARRKGKPDFISISGPGAVGKGTLRNLMGIKHNTINDTTREPRGSGEERERHGEQYFFIDESEMFWRVAHRQPQKDETIKDLVKNDESGEYIYPPVHKPGRGWYALRKEQIISNLDSGNQFVIEDNIKVSNYVLRFIRDDLGRPDINPLHLYILPPGPVMPTLLLRLFTRAEQTNDPRYLVGGKIKIPEETIESTLGQRQIDEFKPIVDLIKDQGNVLFLVNDDLDRMKDIVPNIKDW